MKTLYMLRHEDVHNNSGTGVVAEGVVFDNGMCVITWLTEISTVTVFSKVSDIQKLHGHNGKTEIILENRQKDKIKFNSCKEQVKINKLKGKHK